MHGNVQNMSAGCAIWLYEAAPECLLCLQAIRRGTWLAVQLQLVFACMAFLLTFQALQYASQQPQSGWLHALEAAAPYLAASAVAGALLSQQQLQKELRGLRTSRSQLQSSSGKSAVACTDHLSM